MTFDLWITKLLLHTVHKSLSIDAKQWITLFININCVRNLDSVCPQHVQITMNWSLCVCQVKHKIFQLNNVIYIYDNKYS